MNPESLSCALANPELPETFPKILGDKYQGFQDPWFEAEEVVKLLEHFLDTLSPEFIPNTMLSKAWSLGSGPVF